MRQSPPLVVPNESCSSVEASIRTQLLAEDGLNFSSLVVRSVADGICLEGVLEIDAEGIDVTAAALRIAWPAGVRNNLIVRNSHQCCDSRPPVQAVSRHPR
jgi:hypothetical protein